MATQTFRSIPEMFLYRVEKSPEKTAFLSPQDGKGWKTHTWAETGAKVKRIASGLRAMGLVDEQRAAILSGTRVEWIFADLGILCAGGATTTIYPSNTPDECEYILNDSESQMLFVENDEQLAKIVGIKSRLKTVKYVVNLDGKGGEGGFALTLAEFEEKGAAWDAANPGQYEKIAQAVDKEHLATLIYTSGTTGMPKGVKLTHDCWVFEGEAIDSLGILGPDDVQYLWLPLAHSFGKVLEAAQIRIGVPTAVDGRVDKIVENLGEIRPTFVAAVPRIFEKVYNKVITGAKEGGGLKYSIFKWAVEVGTEVSKLRQAGQEPSGLLGMKYGIATKLVFSKLHARFGGRLRYFISGSAPLNRDIAEFFHAAGIVILEGYGLTESSAASFVNRPDSIKFGSVGLPVPGVQVKIAKEDGEILLHGRGIMKGYHNRPQDTADCLTADGWLKTGDIGELDDKGRLKITDRKKDLIKTSGGKYVAPQELEGRLKLLSPLISQVVVHGNNRNFCSALVTLNEEEIKKWAAANGKSGASYADLAKDPEVKKLIEPAFAELNKQLPSYSTIKKFALLPRDFTIETGELTPSQKVKRKVVETAYKDLLEGFYAGANESV